MTNIIYKLIHANNDIKEFTSHLNDECVDYIIDLEENSLGEVVIIRDGQMVSRIIRTDYSDYDEFLDKAIEYIWMWKY